MPQRLVDRDPVVSTAALVDDLVPPPLFGAVSFAGYQPDPREPTQAEAVEVLERFAARVTDPPRHRRGLFRQEPVAAGGVYLDGGFGVGKTHLLASLWHAVPGPKAYATFVELTHLAGTLGFAGLVDALGDRRLLAIDEFELDDPGDTVLISTLLARLVERGVALAATSNTLPGALGEGRFAAADFSREIQGLASRFDSVRIDGPDYRHRGVPEAPAPGSDDDVRAATDHDGATVDDFTGLLRHLGSLHPSRYGALVDGVTTAGLLQVRPVPEQATALRLVVLVDRLYDRQVPVVASGVPLTGLFSADMLAGGYRKKYLRATSRLVDLSHASAR